MGVPHGAGVLQAGAEKHHVGLLFNSLGADLEVPPEEAEEPVSFLGNGLNMLVPLAVSLNGDPEISC